MSSNSDEEKEINTTVYKIKKEAKKSVRDTKTKAFKKIYKDLDTNYPERRTRFV